MENSYKGILDRVVLSEESEKKLLAIPDQAEKTRRAEKKIVRLQTKVMAAAAVLTVALISAGVWMLSQRNTEKSMDIAETTMAAAAAYQEEIMGDEAAGKGEKSEMAPQAPGAQPGDAQEADEVPAEQAEDVPAVAGGEETGAGDTTAAAAGGTYAEAEEGAANDAAEGEEPVNPYDDYPVFYGNADGFDREILPAASNELGAYLYTQGAQSVEVRIYTSADCLPSSYKDKTFALPDGVTKGILQALSAVEETPDEYDFAGDDGTMIIRYHFTGFTPEEVLAVMRQDS